MDDAVIKLLICPICEGDLRQNGGSLICSNGHTANVARQGYVSLLGRYSGTHTADTVEMVAARERILDVGLFAPVAEAVAARVTGAGIDAVDGAIVDLGTGTGHYLAAALEVAPERIGLGVDNSKFAARRAAKSHPRAGAIVADIWDQIPVRDEAAAVVINVFAPRNGEEINRILAPGGRLVVVTPTGEHLKELIDRFEMISVDPDKDERLERSLGGGAEDLRSEAVEWKLELEPGQVRDLIGMGPSAGRLDPERLESILAELGEKTTVTGSVRISVRDR